MGLWLKTAQKDANERDGIEGEHCRVQSGKWIGTRLPISTPDISRRSDSSSRMVGAERFLQESVRPARSQGYSAFAPDLREGKVARTIDEAKEMMKKENQELAEKTVLGGHQNLHAHPSNKAHKIAVVGVSM